MVTVRQFRIGECFLFVIYLMRAKRVSYGKFENYGEEHFTEI